MAIRKQNFSNGSSLTDIEHKYKLSRTEDILENVKLRARDV